jgi:HD-GYP domain-containing protein (c-di-GMP phosphodiesterase class II)
MNLVSNTQVVYISADPKATDRISSLCASFRYKSKLFTDADALLEETEDLSAVPFAIICAQSIEKKEEITGLVQAVRQVLPNAFLLTVVGKRLSADQAAFIKKSGCQFVLLEIEFLETSILEFVASTKVRSSLIPGKASEFKLNTVVPFPLWYLMPLNKKLLTIVPADSLLDEAKIKKLQAANELLIAREDLPPYRLYSEKHCGVGALDLANRCRVQYLHFCDSFTELVLLLSDQAETSSFKQGKSLYDQCENLAKSLLASLACVEDPWTIVNNTSLEDASLLERSPSVAAFAGIFSLQSGLGEPSEVMIAALIADIGMLDLPPNTTRALATIKDFRQLEGETRADYQKHPLLSVNRCLSRKLQLKDNIRDFVLGSHEQMDGKGFPQKMMPEKIPLESMLIHFSQLLDEKCCVRMGKEKTSPKDALKEILGDSLTSSHLFSIAFLNKIKVCI